MTKKCDSEQVDDAVRIYTSSRMRLRSRFKGVGKAQQGSERLQKTTRYRELELAESERWYRVEWQS